MSLGKKETGIFYNKNIKIFNSLKNTKLHKKQIYNYKHSFKNKNISSSGKQQQTRWVEEWGRRQAHVNTASRRVFIFVLKSGKNLK